MKAIRDNVLIKPFESDNMTAGGLFVPDSCKQISNKGTVISVGKGTPKKPMRLKEGETVYRVKDWGCEVLIDGQLHFLMNQDAVIAWE